MFSFAQVWDVLRWHSRIRGFWHAKWLQHHGLGHLENAALNAAKRRPRIEGREMFRPAEDGSPAGVWMIGVWDDSKGQT